MVMKNLENSFWIRQLMTRFSLSKQNPWGSKLRMLKLMKRLQGLFEFFPNGTPTPAPTFAPYATPSLSKEQEALLKYTATPNATAVATQELPQATATPLPETAEQLPTATPYTEELYKQNYQEYVTNMADINVI